MPLIKSASKEAFSSNVAAERHAGKPLAQSLAIAYAIKRRYKADGGTIDGGRRGSGEYIGSVIGITPGRGDKVNTRVPSGSHIIPADIVSGLGQGNSLAGLALLEKMFPAGGPPKKAAGGSLASPPWYVRSEAKNLSRIVPPHLPTATPSVHPLGLPKATPGSSGPLGMKSPLRIAKPNFPRLPSIRPPKISLAKGGEPKGVDVALSDGEFAISPDWVRHVGDGDQEAGHRAIDKWILKERSDLIRKLGRLPPPNRD